MMRDFSELIARLKQSDDNCNAECYECSGECLSSGCNIFSEAADAIEELLAAVPKWISVEERLPEKHKVVLFNIPWNKTNMIGWIDEDGGINLDGYGKCYDFSLIKPSHWMPLPKAPEEVE